MLGKPVKLHGMGVRSHKDTCEPAWVGALDKAAPYLAQVPALADIMGGGDAWGADADVDLRWATLLASGHVYGRELHASWAILQREAEEAAAFLEEQVEGLLAERVEGAGSDAGGNMRHLIVEQREKVRGRLLIKALEQLRDQKARPAWSWRERDKHTTVWLLCLPGPDHSLCNEEFSEATAALLCLPSPACASRVGEGLRNGARVCKWGDNIANAAMAGDGWRKRHDSMKLLIRRLLVWSGTPVDCEVFNLFASSIPQDGLNRLEGGRRRQGLVPDFRVPAEEGGGSTLCELKCMSASSTRYPQGRRQRVFKRAVDRRADLLTSEYQTKARQTDWDFCGTPRPPQVRQGEPQPVRQIGPVENKLNTYGKVTGWVFGAWGEASEEVHALVQRVAKARLERLDTLPTVRRRQVSRAALLASLVGDVRRQLSLRAVQQQARLLLDKLAVVGNGVGAAAQRRDWAVELEAAASRRRRAQEVSRRQGHSIVRHGFGLI